MALTSRVMNRIIHAVNIETPEKDIPDLDTPEGREFYESLLEDKKSLPEDAIFDNVELDDDELEELEKIMFGNGNQ
jgi:hypothetical protein